MIDKHKSQYKNNYHHNNNENKQTSKPKEIKSKLAKITLITGGTGGHIFPAQVLAQHLQTNNYDVEIILDKRAKNYHNIWGKNTKVHYINAQGFKSNIIALMITLLMLKLGFLQSCIIFLKRRPDCVVSFGGYMSIPAVMVAILFRIPIIMHEQNSYLGKAHKLLLSFATTLALTFAKTKNIPKKVKNIEVTGLPIRLAFYQYRNQVKVKSDSFTVAIMGGSLGANIFGTNIVDAFSKFSAEEQKKIFVYHQVRKENTPAVKKAWAKTEVQVDIQPFFQNMAKILWQSDLVIARSGASTIKELELLGKYAIYIPFAQATDNHQLLNAQNAQNNSQADIILEAEFTSKLLFTKIQAVFFNQDLYYNKSINIKSNAIIDATEHLTKIIANIITK